VYSVKEIYSSIFHMIKFPYDGKVTTIDQVTYSDPKDKLNIDSVVLFVHVHQTISYFYDVSLRVSKSYTLFGTCL
jgi:hypothetical protein